MPTSETVGATGEVLALVDVPDAIADQTNGLYGNYPDGNFTYDTVEVSYQKRLSNFFVQTSADYQWRDDFRSASNDAQAVSTSPLSADPIGIGFYLSPNPAVPNG